MTNVAQRNNSLLPTAHTSLYLYAEGTGMFNRHVTLHQILRACAQGRLADAYVMFNSLQAKRASERTDQIAKTHSSRR